MNNINPDHRTSIRLKGYDYSLPGCYFVTICVQDRACLFGEIIGSDMVLNDAGLMVNKWCSEIPHKFKDIALETFIVMPNHFHAIIINTGLHHVPVGADLRVCPDINEEYSAKDEQNVVAEQVASGEHIASSLDVVIQWFKTMTCNDYIRGVKQHKWPEFRYRLWQRNCFEHIIRNEEDYINTKYYVNSDAANWAKDRLYKDEVL